MGAREIARVFARARASIKGCGTIGSELVLFSDKGPLLIWFHMCLSLSLSLCVFSLLKCDYYRRFARALFHARQHARSRVDNLFV